MQVNATQLINFFLFFFDCCWQIPSVKIKYTIFPRSVHAPLLIMKCIIQISAELFFPASHSSLQAKLYSVIFCLGPLDGELKKNW